MQLIFLFGVLKSLVFDKLAQICILFAPGFKLHNGWHRRDPRRPRPWLLHEFVAVAEPESVKTLSGARTRSDDGRLALPNGTKVRLQACHGKITVPHLQRAKDGRRSVMRSRRE